MEVNYKKISDAKALADRLKFLENKLHEITHPDNYIVSVHLTFNYSGEKNEITFYDETIVDNYIKVMETEISDLKKQIEEL
mgnify:CR=1 FL=1